MRIVIAGPPKTGNVWLKCLLGAIYRLRWLDDPGVRSLSDAAAFRAWVATGGFSDGTIFHRHFDYSSALCEAFEEVDVRVVTILRDPYDAFVSQYFTVQELARAPELAPWRTWDRPRHRDAMAGKPIDHPDVLAFLQAGRLGRSLRQAAEWLECGRSIVVRYEALHADPVGELNRVVEGIAPVEPDRVRGAVERCAAERMRRMSREMAAHVRQATVGDWRNHLSEAHLAIFRDRYADEIRRIGYEVR